MRTHQHHRGGETEYENQQRQSYEAEPGSPLSAAVPVHCTQYHGVPDFGIVLTPKHSCKMEPSGSCVAKSNKATNKRGQQETHRVHSHGAVAANNDVLLAVSGTANRASRLGPHDTTRCHDTEQ